MGSQRGGCCDALSVPCVRRGPEATLLCVCHSMCLGALDYSVTLICGPTNLSPLGDSLTNPEGWWVWCRRRAEAGRQLSASVSGHTGGHNGDPGSVADPSTHFLGAGAGTQT